MKNHTRLTKFNLGGVMYVVYALFNYLLEWDVLADIIYWIMLLFAPFSLIDCFIKMASAQFGLGNNDDDDDVADPSNLNMKY